LALREARHRAHACVEDSIKAAKDTGLAGSVKGVRHNQSFWLQIVAVAPDLTAWLRLLAVMVHWSLAPRKSHTSDCTSNLIRGGKDSTRTSSLRQP
jgi:hypothetical protein